MESFIGDIRLFAGTFAPRGWMLCNGAVLSISQYDTLFSLIGTTYGGDGQSTFALPDLRGRVPVGQGQGPGLTNRVIGEVYGSENVTLVPNQMPQHTHTLNASTATATSAQPAGQLFAQTGSDKFYGPPPATDPQPQAMAANAVTPAGGSQPHTNIMPSMAINYIIAVEGIYPTRN
ncbi:MAG: phage tail protein [Burkholderiales bacterium RIFCSPHIGHO2_01_FULL_64_960]|jgi:microcystin-dependent protein|nr:phage tail protein [Burkholderiaceae bacterium]MBP7501742.1 phage tail protein [Aquabacterium sp.]OGA63904.1 MAG: phage tail protein [Burkholderiales bacterium RIFCSPHIGHO2_01_FULL_64_960]